MQQDEIVTGFLNSAQQDIWSNILSGNIDILLETTKPKKSKQAIFARLFAKKEIPGGVALLFAIIHELFTYRISKKLAEQNFEIMNPNSSDLFQNLTRLLFAIELNGNYLQLEQIVADKLFKSAETIAEEVRKKSNGYPANSINGQVWMGAAAMRTGFFYLIYYYKKKNLIKSQLWVARTRTLITLSIMGHYKEMVGPDMIEVAEIQEKLALYDDAQSHYNAVVLDFENELEYFINDPEAKPTEEEQVILLSLLKSYQGVDRINGTDNYNRQIQKTQLILDR